MILRILAIETATRTCSVALVRDGIVLAERCERAESNHAANVPRLVEDVLDHAGERPTRGEAVAVSIGPGSFTGLRIGLSFAKGLAFAGGLRMVGVATLDALALATAEWDGRLCVALDARKQEVYAALYERHEGRVVRLGTPRAITVASLVDEINALDATSAVTRPLYVIGDAVEAYGEVFRDRVAAGAVLYASAQHPPRASAVARLAAASLARDPSGDDLAGLAPAYLRPPEAEIKQSATRPSAAPENGWFVDKVNLVY